MASSKPKQVWVGVDLGGTKMLARVYTSRFRALSRAKKRTRAQEGQQAGVARMVRLIEASLDEAGVSVDTVAGIGVGSPGPLDLSKGVLLELPNLGWTNVALKRTLEQTFGCPVVVANDVDAGTYGEYRFGAGRKARSVLGVFPGTGIGGGCVYDGRILQGKRNSAMEFGHMRMVENGNLCGCGRRGCLETVASRLSISAAAAAAAYRGQAPHLLATAGMDLANIRSSVLAESIAAGDVPVEQAVRAAAHWLGIAIGNTVNLLLPEKVVLGGGMVEAMPDLFISETRAAAAEVVMPSFENTFEIVPAELGDDATVQGAAAWAMDSTS